MRTSGEAWTHYCWALWSMKLEAAQFPLVPTVAACSASPGSSPDTSGLTLEKNLTHVHTVRIEPAERLMWRNTANGDISMDPNLTPQNYGYEVNRGREAAPYVCPYCRAVSFSSMSDLRRHVRIHTGEKPYACPYCHYRAKRTTHLQDHMRRRHPSPRDRNPEHTLSTHTLAGEQLVCPYCHRSTFKQRSDLKRHIRRHTGEKPYTCPLCNYKAGRSDYINDHLVRHHAQEPRHPRRLIQHVVQTPHSPLESHSTSNTPLPQLTMESSTHTTPLQSTEHLPSPSCTINLLPTPSASHSPPVPPSQYAVHPPVLQSTPGSPLSVVHSPPRSSSPHVPVSPLVPHLILLGPVLQEPSSPSQPESP
ncbi:hypothetical protein Pmani_005199 [Petrolisthes manimaculis]|uniref:C2H2-type domain-containing protein n=1 Tax=Petrolisthes manimaculis TaxID=1843537 RepID=A0AAE1UHS4_9EUCA|nr:hypothetical protein Pmani_005199 [Petrolisthes manimaculis]